MLDDLLYGPPAHQLTTPIVQSLEEVIPQPVKENSIEPQQHAETTPIQKKLENFDSNIDMANLQPERVSIVEIGRQPLGGTTHADATLRRKRSYARAFPNCTLYMILKKSNTFNIM